MVKVIGNDPPHTVKVIGYDPLLDYVFIPRHTDNRPPEGCANSGELAPNFGFEGSFVPVGEDLVPSGWTGTNVTQEIRQQLIHGGQKAVLLGHRRPDDATLTTIINSGVCGGCYYLFSFFAGGEGPAAFEGEVTFGSSQNALTPGGIIRVVGQSKTSGVGQYYRIITGQAPIDTVAVRIDFRKIGLGTVVLDDVSLTIA